MPDPSCAREHYQSFVRKKSTKSVKQSKVITYQPKTFENLNIFHIKPVIIEHPKIFHGDTRKSEKFLTEKNVKITKRVHAFKSLSSSFNVDILTSFDPELQPKDTESAIKIN